MLPVYLNSNKSLENYLSLFRSKYFIDKSEIIEILNERICTSDKYVCITRPRRFGKSSFLKNRIFDEYFGFTEYEVKNLCDKNKKMDFYPMMMVILEFPIKNL